MSSISGNLTAPVNGKMTASPLSCERLFYRSMLKDVLSRIDQRLAKVGLSPSAASKAAGMSPDAIRNLQRRADDRDAGVSTTTLRKLAPILKTTDAWLMSGEGEEDIEGTGVPLVGYVSAGSEAHFFTDDVRFDEVPAPVGASDETVAVEIRGESLGPMFDRWIAYYDDVRNPVTPDLVGNLCIVRLTDGRTLIKKLTRSATPGLFHLISQNEAPITDVAVEWAAKVTHISKR